MKHLTNKQHFFQSIVDHSPDGLMIVDGAGRIQLMNTTMERMIQVAQTETFIGDHLTAFVAPDNQELCQNQLSYLIQSAETPSRFELLINGKERNVLVEINATTFDHDGVPMIQMMVRDITERQQATEELEHAHQAAAERANRFRLLVEMGRDLISTHEMNDLLHMALQRAITFSGYDSGTILLFVKDGLLEVCASLGIDAIPIGTRVENLDTSISGWVLQAQKPLVLEGKNEQFGANWRTYTRSLPLTVNLPLIVPSGDSVGVLALKSTNHHRPLTADDLDALQLLASQLAVTVESSRLYEENKSLLKELEKREIALLDLVERLMTSQEEERRRIAYELHDGLAQVAASAHQHLQTFAGHYRSRSEKMQAELNQALKLAQRVVKETRQVMAGLRPTVLDDFGLASALRHEINTLRTEQWDITYNESPNVLRLPPSVETAFFRVAQEALNNIRKHALSSQVRVSLSVQEHTICLEVQDWGPGFDMSSHTGDSGTGERIGLLGMQERMAMLGGTCTIQSTPGEGTLVIAQAPLPTQC